MAKLTKNSVCPVCLGPQKYDTEHDEYRCSDWGCDGYKPSADKSLIEKYDEVYKDGEEKFWTFLPIEERLCMLKNLDLYDKIVLDIGCGTGDFAAWLASSGAKAVLGIDPSEQAMRKASKRYSVPNLFWHQAEIGDRKGMLRTEAFDVVTMVGVLEHVQNIENAIRHISNYMKKGATLATSSPNFLNPRGWIWIALKYLFDLPMSLTDKHEIYPKKLVPICKKFGLELTGCEDVDRSWGCGEKFIIDFKQRLPKVLGGGPGLQKQIDCFLEIVENMKTWPDDFPGEGANLVYFFERV